MQPPYRDSSTYPETYAAFFTPRSHKFETVDFRVAASPFNLRTYFPKTTRSRQLNARIAGILGLVVGLLVAIVGFGIDQLTRGLTLALYRLTSHLLLTSSSIGACIVFLLISLLYVFIPAIFVIYVAPLGAGSGIPELKAYLNGVRVPGFLSIYSLAVKAIGIAFSISSGLVCGKQGPVIHAGAIIGAAVSQAASTKFRFRLHAPKFLRLFRTEAWKRDFTAVGAAVGVAVAFGAPMGAWMWVYEEACTHWNWELGIITLTACLSGAIIAKILNYLASGLPGGGFGTFTLTQFGKLVTSFDGTSFPLKDIPSFIILGIIGGVVGAILPVINRSITLFRYRRVTKPMSRLFETLGIALMTAIIKFLIPYIAGKDSCVNIIDNNSDSSTSTLQDVLNNAPLTDFSRFFCPDGQFSRWAATIYNPTDSIARGLIFNSDDNAFQAVPVTVAFFFFFIFMIWTYGVAVPAGVFFPAFLLGSIYGRLLGIVVQLIFQQRNDVSVTGYAFLGAVSALAGITRTISVSVIALEATGGNNASFATVLVALIAKLVGDFLYNRGIYDLHVALKGMPYLANVVPKLEHYSCVRVKNVMESRVIGARRRSRVKELLYMLNTNTHHAFPVFLKVENTVDNLLKDSNDDVDNNINNNCRDHDQRRAERDSNISASMSGSGSGSGSDGAEQQIHKKKVHDDNLEDDENDNTSAQPSSIITPTVEGMQATIFDEGRKRIVWLPDRPDRSGTFITDEGLFDLNLPVTKDENKNKNTQEKFTTNSIINPEEESRTNITVDNDEDSIQKQQDDSKQAKQQKRKQQEERRKRGGGGLKNNSEIEDLDYQLMGMIDRSTILTLLKLECDKHENNVENDEIISEQLDAAWPNPSRLKGDEEEYLLKRVHRSNILEITIDLKDFIDPDPLLISDRAHTMSAYRMFRRTGARHLLVANMRSGKVCGILTRKDVLEDSIAEVLEERKKKETNLQNVKVD